MTISLLKYNNYYSRTIKRFSTVDELLERDDVVVIGTFENVNFNPGDGVATQLTLNYTEGPAANYLVAEDTDGAFSSWFVLDAQYVRFGQYTLSLRRDLVNDLWSILADSPFFVEKAMLSANNPLIFNNESMTFNQIKTNETLIKDKTNIPWIVGYVSKNIDAKTLFTIEIKDNSAREDGVESITDISSITGTNDGTCKVMDKVIYRLNFYDTISSWLGTYKQYAYMWDSSKNPAAPFDNSQQSTDGYKVYFGDETHIGYEGTALSKSSYDYEDDLIRGLNKSVWTFTPSELGVEGEIQSKSDYDSIVAKVGTTYKIGDTYYILRKEAVNKPKGILTKDFLNNQGKVGIAFVYVGTELLNNDILDSVNNLTTPYQVNIQYTEHKFYLEEIPSPLVSLTVNSSHIISKAPYDVFCIPYGEIDIQWPADNIQRTDKDTAYKLASAIIEKWGSNLYDIQLLPYCPLPDVQFNANNRIIPDLYDSALENYKSCVLWVEQPDFSLSIDANITIPTDPIEVKIANETDIYRLSSPNYNGSFEFSVVKNGGVQSFDVDCSYKPFTPYIRISPSFGGLYGQDFNDARGLILGGDFSLPQIRNEWQEYQIQNKNYQVMFDRQIENMDVNNSIQRKMELGNIITGIATGATTGGIAGSMTPFGPAGMAAGIAIGGAASAIGGALDRKYNEQLRQEARDYTIDQFGYQLGNIQARPNSITKVSAFNPNNKVFPVLEYYTATGVEKNALRNKLQYNGMTVMAIGTIAEYLQTEPSYIKGKLIRLNNDMEDYHIVNALADELYQGVYV